MAKYGNKKAVRGNLTFDSKKEAERFDQLVLLQRAGQIENLKLQPTFTLQEAFTDLSGRRVKAITYKADFSYILDGVEIVEDVKGFKTEVYKLKEKLMAGKGIQVQEV